MFIRKIKTIMRHYIISSKMTKTKKIGGNSTQHFVMTYMEK